MKPGYSEQLRMAERDGTGFSFGLNLIPVRTVRRGMKHRGIWIYWFSKRQETGNAHPAGQERLLQDNTKKEMRSALCEKVP